LNISEVLTQEGNPIMAGDWIKVETVTPSKPEVVGIAEILGIDDHCAFGKLIYLWIWADQQSIDGNAVRVTKSFIDRYTCVTGFAHAMEKVGWLTGQDGALTFPNFNRHNGKSAKTRSETTRRVKRFRNAASVTDALPEKRREEKSKKYLQGAELPSSNKEDATVMEFPITGPKGLPKTWALTPENLAALQEAYPSVDVPAECKKAKGWCYSNPLKRKTAGGMKRFLNTWMSKRQNEFNVHQSNAKPRPSVDLATLDLGDD
jgi:hypothetical protein